MIDLADSIVPAIINKQVADGVGRNIGGTLEVGRRGRSVVAAEAVIAVAGGGEDHAGRKINLADPVIGENE